MSGKNRLNSFILFVYIIGETRDRLDLAFSMYDINGDGLIDKKELSQFLSKIKIKNNCCFFFVSGNHQINL